MVNHYKKILAAVLAVLLTVSGCAGSGSAESTGGTDSTGNVLAFVDPTAGTATEAPTSGTDGTEATTAPTSGTEATDAIATEANSPTTGGSSVSTEATEATDAPTSPPNTEATEATTPSGGGSSGNSGNSGSSGSEATTPTTEATEPTTEPVVVHTHSYKKTVVSPTCTASGYTVYTCSCGDSYTSDYVDALGHDWKSNGAVNEGYWLYQLICGCGKVFDTLEEWEVHSAEVYASGDLYTYYADCCHWASHDNWVVTRAGSERVCTRCGEEYFEDHTEECKSEWQIWAEKNGLIP